MSEAIWWAMLLALYVVAAMPAVALILYLRRTAISEIARRFLSAILAAFFVSPALAVLGHMPLVLPFAATFFFDNTRGLHVMGGTPCLHLARS